jgi:PAS domain S-box-containing protein
MARIKAAQASLRKIPAQDVDALVLFGRRGPRIVTLRGETAYRMLVEAMSEGAATLSPDGVILYCNRKFAELAGRSKGKLVGSDLRSLIDAAGDLDGFLRLARKRVAKGEFSLVGKAGQRIPVHLSLGALQGYRGQALGMVVTDLTEQRKKQEAELRRAESIHRLVLERELAAQEAERRRIARELHDEAGQLLTSLLVALKTLEDSKDLAGCKVLGRRMRSITAQAIDDLGRMARGLHPIALDDHGLSEAVNAYVSEYSKTHSIVVDLDEDGLYSVELPPAVQIALYRILQESLTNVARHAQAKHVQVVFRHSEKRLIMTVSDDGRGFDAGAAAAGRSNHLGLQSIRERAVMLGGEATFRSGHHGTEVRIEIPLRQNALSSRAMHAKG